MKPFSLLIKPASADCNMACTCCFYSGRKSLYTESKIHRMKDSVLEAMIRTYMGTEQPVFVFHWQGGEPTLIGPDFFYRATELENKYRPKGALVMNTFQTNATMIDIDFARVFSFNNFLVGVSLDGPPLIHNHYRQFSDGTESYDDVMSGIERLRANNVEFNILCLVTDVNVTKGKELYRFFIEKGFCNQQYIPCVEFDSHGQPRSFTVSGDRWGEFLCEVFDEWNPWDVNKVSIGWFDSIISCLLGRRESSCPMGKTCCQYFLVEYNGDVYPCDFFVYPELRIGNIMGMSWQQLFYSKKYRSFGSQKLKANKKCLQCEYIEYCSADCLKHRMFHGTRNATELSWLCNGYKVFFQHALPKLKRLAQMGKKDEVITSESDPITV